MKVHSKIFLFLILFLISCQGVRSIYEKRLNVDKSDINSVSLLEKTKLNNNQSIIYFCESFDNKLQIEVNGKIVFDRKLKTIEQLGYAGSCIVENDKDVSIIVDNKKYIKLNSEKLPKYKFIYVAKNKRNYKIEYTNKAKSFR
ncbi:hypothetical protein [Chryseobacterium gambrini]|uniref:hypothetical protein n=1 Tax=Chryseobacterium gambrini TaxID=373672 RepID=UPI0025B2FA5A|nr:hypothetical protein [Chryseobacterium gambrini]MDN4030187.1 hypothetical protein [Chryseobacterium gambrini]